MVMKTCLVVLWFMIPCSLVASYQHFGSSMSLQNVGNYIPAYEGSTQKMGNLGDGGLLSNVIFLLQKVICFLLIGVVMEFIVLVSLLLKCHCHMWAYSCTFPLFVPVCICEHIVEALVDVW